MGGVYYSVGHQPLIFQMKLVGTDEWEKEEDIWLMLLVIQLKSMKPISFEHWKWQRLDI